MRFVKIISGKYKNKCGFVNYVKYDNKYNPIVIFIKDINLVKKHIKSDLKRGISGEIINKEAGIHYSNIIFLS